MWRLNADVAALFLPISVLSVSSVVCLLGLRAAWLDTLRPLRYSPRPLVIKTGAVVPARFGPGVRCLSGRGAMARRNVRRSGLRVTRSRWVRAAASLALWAGGSSLGSVALAQMPEPAPMAAS